MQAAQLLGRTYRRFPIRFLRHILPNERGGRAKFGCQLAAFRLDHIANDDLGSFRDEQASLGCTLPACSSTDEYDFPFEAIHFVLHSPEELRCCSLVRIMRCLQRPSGYPRLATLLEGAHLASKGLGCK